MRIELKRLGLSEKEIEIYLAGLKAGPLTVQKLAEIAKVKRPTAYEVLDHLKELNLVNRSIIAKKKVFEMASGRGLLNLIEKEKEEMKEKEEGIMKIISNIEAVSQKAQLATDIKMYEGQEGIEEVMVRFASKDEPFYSMYSTYYIDEMDQKWLARTVKKINQARINLKSKIYVITDYNPISVKLNLIDNIGIREFRFFDTAMKLPAMVDVCGDEVALSSVHEKYSCILIQNKTIAETLKFTHGVIWKSLERKGLLE